MAACANDAVPSHNPPARNRKLTALAVIAAVLVFVSWPEGTTLCRAADEPDAVDQKLVALRKSVGTAMSPERVRQLLGEALALIDEAIVADEYTSAVRVAGLAVEIAGKLENEHLLSVCARRKDEVANFAKEAKKLTKSMQKLRKNPKDSTANFEVGRFRCIVLGNWDRGLPLVAQGSNATWGEVAKKDLASPANADGQNDVGDDWARLASVEKGPAKRAIALRAAYWYRQVLIQPANDARTKALSAMELLPICFVTDLDETESKPGPWPIGKRGDVGVGRPIEVNGIKYPFGIGMHPPDSGEAVLTYRLNGQYKTLTTGVAINDLMDPFGGSITFVVVGDGEVLWKSPAVKSRGTAVFCDVSLKGVKTLQLKTQAMGNAVSGHAVWLDPSISR